MSQIVLRNVSKCFNGVAALDDVSLSVVDDTTTAVVGPSGGGKSTLLQLINGLVRPDSGRVTVFDKPIDYDKLPQLRLQIGYAVQGTGLFPHMTVWQNITLLARLNGWQTNRTRERAHQLMNLVGLPGAMRGRYSHELSGGEQQRVGLCRAMMLNPRVFLLDEPFGALDPITREEIQREFARIQKSEARTTLLVTHDLREAMRLGDRLVILNEGRVVQDATREDVLDHPADDFVKSLVHSQLDTWRLEDSD
jgi:osmoprotectant transport system ATP-binding protein